jgi:hypothetical protein
MTPIQTERARRPVRLSIPVLVAIVLAAGVLGGVIASYLPFGAKSPLVQRGHAAVAVQWSDGSSAAVHEGRPSCLAAAKGSTANAAVEAGYVWVRGPEGGSYPIVTWIRCL